MIAHWDWTTLIDVIGNPTDGNVLAGFLSTLVALVVAITVHEFAHAKRAQMAGDPTPETFGRVTLNPIAHYDPIGTTMIMLAGFGWGKPVPVNPALFGRRRRDEIMVSLWGPASNFLVAVLFAWPLKFGLAGPYTMVLEAIVQINLMLGIFNLIPVHPLDGSHILAALLPDEQAQRLQYFYHRFGLLLLLALIITRATTIIVGVPLGLAYYVLAGPFPFGLLAFRGADGGAPSGETAPPAGDGSSDDQDAGR